MSTKTTEPYLGWRLEKTLALYNLGLDVFGLERVQSIKPAHRLYESGHSEEITEPTKRDRRPASGEKVAEKTHKLSHGMPKAEPIETVFNVAERILDQISGIKDVGYNIGNISLSDNSRVLRIVFEERVEAGMTERDFMEHMSEALNAANMQEYAGTIVLKGDKSGSMIRITANGKKAFRPFMKAYAAFLIEHNLNHVSAERYAEIRSS